MNWTQKMMDAVVQEKLRYFDWLKQNRLTPFRHGTPIVVQLYVDRLNRIVDYLRSRLAR